MKILWQLYDGLNYTGGPAINAVRLLPEFKKIGYEVLAIVGYNGKGHSNADKLRELGVQCYVYKRPEYSKDHVKIFFEVLKAYDPDIFVSNISAQAAFSGKWAQKWGIPVIHTLRSDDDLNNGMANFFFYGPKKWKLSALVSVNNFLLDKLKLNNCQQDFISAVIPSGVALSNNKCNQQNTDKINVVYAGRLIQPQKRIFEVLKAFISLAKISQKFDFTIIGSGEEYVENRLNEIVKNEDLSDRIRFTGKLEGENYIKELVNHQVIVLLSDYEGTPGSLMDGMSCGLIPVSLNIDGMDELIKNYHNGMLINDRETSFIEALNFLYKNSSKRIELSKNAIKTIKERYSLNIAVQLWDMVFQDLKNQFYKNKSFKTPKNFSLPKANKLLLEHKVTPPQLKKTYYKLKNILNL